MATDPRPMTAHATILLPAYNESACIRRVVEEVRREGLRLATPPEILVVDDGSTDATASIARDCGARVVRHAVRRGAGAALKTGILEARGERILLMDADGSYPPAAIPGLLSALDDCRQAIGSRTSEAGSVAWLRASVKFLLRKLGEFLVRHPIPDLNTGMRAFARRDALAFFHLLPDGHSCVSTLTLCFIAMGLPVRFLPVDYSPRVGSSKFRVVFDTFRFLVQILRSVTYFAPLRVFLGASALLFLSGVAKSAFDISRTGGLEESDILLFTFSVATGMLGLLADMVARQSRKAIFDELFPSKDVHG